jgi:two-component system, LytTR family, response regulator
MTRVILIDDEPLARMIVAEYLQAYPQLSIVEECNNGFEGVKAIGQHKPDLIFLDIQMPKINGFEMLELLDKPPAVIFTTAFDEYALRAFEAHAVDYLLKPFTKDRFDKALQKWMEQRASTDTSTARTAALLETVAQSPARQDRIVVKTGNKIAIVPVQEVHYLEAYDDFVKIHTAQGMFVKNKTMHYFEQQLNSRLFVRVHRSYILQIQQITRIDPYQKDSYIAVLRTGAQIPVSRTGYARLKEVLGL